MADQAKEVEELRRRLEVLEEEGGRLLGGADILPRSPTAAFDSGTYTPTLTNGTNVAAATALECQWLRIDDIVNVSGKVNVDPTSAATTTILGVSLPISSNIGAEEDVSGVCGQHDVSAPSGGSIRGNNSTSVADLLMHPIGDGNAAWSFIFQYQLLGS